MAERVLAVARTGPSRTEVREFPMLTRHTFGLDHVDEAIKSVGGKADEGVAHVSLLPWAGLPR